MLDLSQERMVPLKTIGRTRGGRECILMMPCTLEHNATNYIQGYRWLWGKLPVRREAPGGGAVIATHWTTDRGRYFSIASNSEGEDDIVAIQKPRTLLPGDVCMVTGMIACPHMDRDHSMIFVKELEIALIEKLNGSEGAVRETWCFAHRFPNDMSLNYYVERQNLTFVRRPS